MEKRESLEGSAKALMSELASQQRYAVHNNIAMDPDQKKNALTMIDIFTPMFTTEK